MAGKGERTQSLGEFKPFIQINNKKTIQWFFKSVKNNIKPSDNLIFITTRYFAEKYDVKYELNRILKSEDIINNFDLITAEETPPGPSASVYYAKEYLDENPVIVINCDQFITFELLENIENLTGYLPVNTDFGSSKSYVRIENGEIIEIVEKNNISNIASAGVYIVSNGNDLVWALEKQFQEKQTHKGEYYVGPALNNLKVKGYKFYPIATKAKYDLGNIEQIEFFASLMKETCNAY